MKRHSLIACSLLGIAALCGPSIAQAAPQALHEAEVRHVLPVATACPTIFATLPERLIPAWRALDSAAQVVVDFNLDGSTITDLKVSGGHGGYAGLVRSAVRAMQCSASASVPVAVRFHIRFVYPEDQSEAVAIAFSDVDTLPTRAEKKDQSYRLALAQ